MNIQSIIAHYDETVNFINTHKSDILFLTETHLTADVEDFELSIENYNIFRVDSDSRHTGGVMAYIKKGNKSPKFKFYSPTKKLLVFNDKHTNVYSHTTLCCLYRSRSASTIQFLSFFEDWCGEYLDQIKGDILILGDFNINWKSDDIYTMRLKRCVNDNGLKPI